eukprot:1367556-Rhodomonas_salina.1
MARISNGFVTRNDGKGLSSCVRLQVQAEVAKTKEHAQVKPYTPYELATRYPGQRKHMSYAMSGTEVLCDARTMRCPVPS